MICPHCKKPINKKLNKEDIKIIMKYHKEGFSLRDIEAKIGRKFSFSTVSRIINNEKNTNNL